jgi:predicted 2-oxoglutarate/Fe(II)-dependent dioxygenase YbiX
MSSTRKLSQSMRRLLFLALVGCCCGASTGASDNLVPDESEVNVNVALRQQGSRVFIESGRGSPEHLTRGDEGVTAALAELLRFESFVNNYVGVALSKAQRLRKAAGGGGAASRAGRFRGDGDSGDFGGFGGFGDFGDDALADATVVVTAEGGAARQGGGVAAMLEETVRKKDAPVDAAGVLEAMQVQRKQKERVHARFRPGKPQRRLEHGEPAAAQANAAVAAAVTATTTWELPCGEELYGTNWYGAVGGCSPAGMGRCWRRLQDGVASEMETARAAKAAQAAMKGLFHQGGATSLVPDAAAQRRLGAGGLALMDSLRARAREHIAAAANLTAPLYDSGALLMRLDAEFADDAYEVNHSHAYWNPHVDKANIASYDYSALLYLNAQGNAFEGGDFAFVDEDDDKTVAPRAGRLLTFTSGLENLHLVREVTKGSRLVLAMWFTCSEQHQYRAEPAT